MLLTLPSKPCRDFSVASRFNLSPEPPKPEAKPRLLEKCKECLGLLGGSGVVISVVISPLIRVISIVTLVITLLITTHASKYFSKTEVKVLQEYRLGPNPATRLNPKPIKPKPLTLSLNCRCLAATCAASPASSLLAESGSFKFPGFKLLFGFRVQGLGFRV